MAAAGLAFDIGRFYSEKRFLQNAADAGALAVANALIRGETNTDAEAEGRDVLTRNLIGQPDRDARRGHDDARIRVRPRGRGRIPHQRHPHLRWRGPRRDQERCRLHVRTRRRVRTNRVGGRARVEDRRRPPADRRAALHQRPRPVRRRGRARAMATPTSSRTSSRPRTRPASAARPTARSARRRPPAARSTRRPQTTTRSTTDRSSRSSARARQPSNARELPRLRRARHPQLPVASPPSNVFYNGVTAGTNANTLKAMEAGWVATGYPGPDFPPVTTPPDPNDQVGDHRRQLVGHRSSTPSTTATTPGPRSSPRSIRARSRASRTSATRSRARRRSTRTRPATARSR